MTDLKLALVGDLQKTRKAERNAVATGLRDGMQDLTGVGKKRLRLQMTRAGLGERLAKTWRDRVYPAAKLETLEPAGVIWSNAPKIVRAFSEGTPIRSGRAAGWLAIPTDLAPPSRKRGARRKRMSMEDFLDEFGEDSLRVFAQPGSAGRVMLAVADKGFARGRGKRGGSRRLKDKARVKPEPLLMYVIVRQVRLRQSLNIDSVERALLRLAPDYISRKIVGGLSDGQ